MKTVLIRQALFLPIVAMLIPILMAFTLPGYSSVSQHISEVELLHHPIALVQRTSALVTGFAVALFGIGAVIAHPPRFGFTALAAILFGASMVSNGIVVMGSPLHGLYGMGLFMSLVPAFFVAEASGLVRNRWFLTLSLLCAVFNLAYMWLMISGFDPPAWKGVTQRFATLVIFGWYSMAAYALLPPNPAHFGAAGGAGKTGLDVESLARSADIR